MKGMPVCCVLGQRPGSCQLLSLSHTLPRGDCCWGHCCQALHPARMPSGAMPMFCLHPARREVRTQAVSAYACRQSGFSCCPGDYRAELGLHLTKAWSLAC